MEFNKAHLFTSVYADNVKVGSRGYFADDLKSIKNKVEEGGPLSELKVIYAEDSAVRFAAEFNKTAYFLFYLVKEPEEKKFCPYTKIDEIPSTVVRKSDNAKLLIAGARNNEVYIVSEGWTDMKALFDYYTWDDGSVCGLEVADEANETYKTN